MSNVAAMATDLCAKNSTHPEWLHDLWDAILSHLQRLPELRASTQNASDQTDVLIQFVCTIADQLTDSADVSMEEQFVKWLDHVGRTRITQTSWSASSEDAWCQLLIQLVLANVFSTDRIIIHLSGETWKSILATAKDRQFQSLPVVNAITRYLLLFDDPLQKAIDLRVMQRLLGQRSVLCRTDNLRALFQAIAKLAKLSTMSDLDSIVKTSCSELLHDICSSSHFRCLASRRLVTIHKVFRDCVAGGSTIPSEDSSLAQALQLLMVSSQSGEISSRNTPCVADATLPSRFRARQPSQVHVFDDNESYHTLELLSC